VIALDEVLTNSVGLSGETVTINADELVAALLPSPA